METVSKISALIITFNEENNIREVIENLHFADEIIILDSFSTDKTLEIVSTFKNVRFYQNKFSDFTTQRNIAIGYASHDWILFLDADERISSNLETEIAQIIALKIPKNAYFFKRKFFYKNKPIHFSGTQSDKNYRLFRKSKCYYLAEKLVHETLVVQGEVGVLKHKLDHYSFADYQTYKQKMVQYGELKAKELFAKKIKYNPIKHFVKTSFKFIQTFLIRLGFLDGINGITVCYLQAFNVHTTFWELKKLQKKSLK